MIALCSFIRSIEPFRLCVLLFCPSVFTHLSACEIIVVIQFLVSYCHIRSPLYSYHVVSSMNFHSSHSLLYFFAAFSPVQRPKCFPSLFLFHFSFHSSFSSCFYLRCFPLNALNIDRWDIHGPSL